MHCQKLPNGARPPCSYLANNAEGRVVSLSCVAVRCNALQCVASRLGHNDATQPEDTTEGRGLRGLIRDELFRLEREGK
jgi:hypothetical protein